MVFARWKAARRASVDALRAADPDARYAWAHTPLKPRTLATTRLAEHWAHAIDVTVPFAIPLPDTDRLRHIAWLGHSTLPYGFAFNGQEAHDVYVELTAPDGAEVWRFGPSDADSNITGAAARSAGSGRSGSRRRIGAGHDGSLCGGGPQSLEETTQRARQMGSRSRWPGGGKGAPSSLSPDGPVHGGGKP